MKAVILVGGAGTRLRPVTYEIPKPLLPVHKKPIVNHLIELFFKNGIEEVALLASAGHKDDFRRWQKAWDEDIPMDRIKIVYEEKPLGTFGGLLLLREWLGNEDFVVSNGDELKDFDLRSLIKFHQEDGAVVTLALTQVAEPQHYGVPLLEKGKTQGRVKEYFEKPENPQSDFVSAGLYVMNPSVFNYVDAGKEFLMTEVDVSPHLTRQGKLAAMHMIGSRWYDCGTLERWEKAMKEW